MNTSQQIADEDTPGEIDFSRAECGKFYHPKLQLRMPIHLEPAMMAALIDMSGRKKIKLSALINELINKGFESLETTAVDQ